VHVLLLEIHIRFENVCSLNLVVSHVSSFLEEKGEAMFSFALFIY